MPEYVRVKQVETGHELSVTRGHYEAVKDGYKPIDKPAIDSAGDPLPPKHHVLSSQKRRQATPASTPGQKATTGKEGA